MNEREKDCIKKRAYRQNQDEMDQGKYVIHNHEWITFHAETDGIQWNNRN